MEGKCALYEPGKSRIMHGSVKPDADLDLLVFVPGTVRCCSRDSS